MTTPNSNRDVASILKLDPTEVTPRPTASNNGYHPNSDLPPFEFLNEVNMWPTYDVDGKMNGWRCSNDGIKQLYALQRWKERLPASELAGWKYAEQLQHYITTHSGRYMRDDHGRYYILLPDARVLIDPANDDMKRFLCKVCNITSVSREAEIATERLRIEATSSSGRMQFKTFSTITGTRGTRAVYVPLTTGELLRVDGAGITTAPNGDNSDQVWLEHPNKDPLDWTVPTSDTVRQSLRDFERLLIDTQSCRVPEMRWFVAMHEGLFPFVRDAHEARLILVHRGGSQCGKTSAAQRFTKLHGLGRVKGDFSVAALRNMPDCGLLALDNKEHDNFTRDLIDFCLFLATGAESGRSNQDGTIRESVKSRPTGVITSIEGVVKEELQKRCVDVQYWLPPATADNRLPRGPIEDEITEQRHNLRSALMVILQTYLVLRSQYIRTPNPVPDFEEHFTTLCYLLRAYGIVAGRDTTWAEQIISAWSRTIDQTTADVRGEISDLEETVLYVLNRIGMNQGERHDNFTYDGVIGTLYVTEATPLLQALREAAPQVSLPKNAQGLTSRLRGNPGRGYTFLQDTKDSPLDIPHLKRHNSARPIGFFVPRVEVRS